MVKIEVETETKEQVIEAVQAKADVIMFDNRTPDEIKAWIGLFQVKLKQKLRVELIFLI